MRKFTGRPARVCGSAGRDFGARSLEIELLEDRLMLSAVTIFAAGTTGQEIMQLQIDGLTVQTYADVGGNANAGEFLSFTYDSTDSITPGQVKIAFTNDLYDEANNIDRNLRVDAIDIDGVRFETEAPEVFSTGTWKAEDGIVPGFRESEYLHTSGYFQYADSNPDPGGDGSLIIVSAFGSTGQETMQLRIDGSTVQTWTNVSTTRSAYIYQAADTITAAQIRVAFTNDLYDETTGTDRNLNVDLITLDGTVFQTEDPSVFSTGTWKLVDGIVPGYRESEWLHTNGYFQYDASQPPDPGNGSAIEIIAAGDTGQETMQLQIDGTPVKTWTNVGPLDVYTYVTAAPVIADQIRVAFTNDAIVQGADRNLRVDYISIDGVIYQTESPSVFSTGTWTPEFGVTPGYRESEYLHTDGYFQYAGGALNHGLISLENSVIDVNEDDDTATITVLRQQGSDGVVTVDYHTVGGTAVAGQDYISQSSTLTFLDGQTSQIVSIPIVNDTLREPNETFGFTIDNVSGGASLFSPRTATVTIFDDEADLPNFASFELAQNLTLNGDALISGSLLRLTPSLFNKTGSAFYEAPLIIDSQSSFQTHFEFKIDGGDGVTGAGGLAFVMQNSADALNALGSGAAGLGYQGILQSLAIEFDTFQDATDINENHVSIVLNGNVDLPLKTVVAPIDFNGVASVNAWIDYNGIQNVLAIYISTDGTKPAAPLLAANVDLVLNVGSQAYLGFAAATGATANVHDILNWDFSTQAPPPIDPPLANVVAQNVAEDLSLPTAIDWSDNGQNLLIAEKGGRVKVVRDGIQLATVFIDISDQVNSTGDRGLLDIAVHPDFVNHPYIYLLYTYDPPEVLDHLNDALARPDGAGNRAGRLTRVTADAATNYTTAVAGSEVLLLGSNSTWNNFNGFVNSTFDFDEPPAGILPDGSNLQDFINSDSLSHTVGAVEFGPNGELFVSIGDGASYNQVDPRAVRVQDIDNLSGKVLRIDPLTGAGLADNPFYNGDPNANRSKVYQYGLRNPFRLAVDQTTGQVYVGDVGWFTWEEVNAAGAGANFGWPYYEGASGSGTSTPTPGYKDLPEAQLFYASGQPAESSIFALNHTNDGINAIVLGDIYSGTAYPAEYQGDLFVNDLSQGIVRNISFDASGNITAVETFTTGASIVVQIKLGPDGLLYFVDLDNGTVGNWVFA